jgi:hypothetical protein
MKSILSILTICISFGLSSNTHNIQDNNKIENTFNINKANEFNNELNKHADKYPEKFKNEEEKLIFKNKTSQMIINLEKTIQTEESTFLMGDLLRKSHNAEFTSNSHQIAYEKLMNCIKEFKSSKCKLSLAKHVSQIKKDNFKSTEVLLRSIDMSSIKDLELKQEIYRYKVLINLSNKKFSSAHYNIGNLLSIEKNKNNELFKQYFEIESQQKSEKINKTVRSPDFLDSYNFESTYDDAFYKNLLNYALNSNFLLDKNESKLIGFIGSMIKNIDKSNLNLSKIYYDTTFKQDKLLIIKSIYYSGIEFEVDRLIQHEPFLIKNHIEENKAIWIENGKTTDIKLDGIEKYEMLLANYYVSKDNSILERMLIELKKTKSTNNNDINKALCTNSIEWFIRNNLENKNIINAIKMIKNKDLIKIIEEIKEKKE